LKQKIAKRGSFKNISNILAKRHQWKFTLDLLHGELFNDECHCGPRKKNLISGLLAVEKQKLIIDHELVSVSCLFIT